MLETSAGYRAFQPSTQYEEGDVHATGAASKVWQNTVPICPQCTYLGGKVPPAFSGQRELVRYLLACTYPPRVQGHFNLEIRRGAAQLCKSIHLAISFVRSLFRDNRPRWIRLCFRMMV